MATKLLLVDDYKDTLDGHRKMFGNVGFDVIVAGPVDPVADARQAWSDNPDLRLALVDLEMPPAKGKLKDKSVGLSLISELKTARPEARIAILSGHKGHDELSKAAKSEADGFIFKTWSPKKQKQSVAILQAWIATAPLHTLLATARLSPHVDQRISRVSRICRQIIARLYGTNAEAFDLTACLAAAELHVLGSTTSDDEIPYMSSSLQTWPFPDAQLEEQTKFAYELSKSYDGFEDVGRILAMRRRCFTQPAFSWIVDAPDGDHSRKNAVPLEARVLGVACAFNALMSRSSIDATSALRALTQLKEITKLGKFDPDVVDALSECISESMDEVLVTLRSGQTVGQMVLSMEFDCHRKVTLLWVAQVCEMLSKPCADSPHNAIVLGITVHDHGFSLQLRDDAARIERLRLWIKDMMNDAARLQGSRDNMDPGIVHRLESLLTLAPKYMEVIDLPQ